MAANELALSSPMEGSGSELAPSALSAAAVTEVQAAVVLAKKFPRNEERAYQRMMKALDNWAFADDCLYEFKRGRKQDPKNGEWVDNFISGLSIHALREVVKFWGNVRYGHMVIGESEEYEVPLLLCQAFAWDLETNIYRSEGFRVPKLIQRKEGKGAEARTIWVTPDERDLRETINRYGAIATRNCLTSLIRRDYLKDFERKANETFNKGIGEDPERHVKELILGFGQLNVTPEMLEIWLGHPIAQASPAEIGSLRQMWKAVAAGETRWRDYERRAEDKPANGAVKPENLKPSRDTNRGHEGANPITRENFDQKLREERESKASQTNAPPFSDEENRRLDRELAEQEQRKANKPPSKKFGWE